MDKFEIKIVAPDRLFYEGEADMLEFTTTEGAMGIYKNHIPTTVILVPCVIRLHKDGNVEKYMVSGGFIEILSDTVTIMAEDVLGRDEIDVKRAEDAKKRAESRLLQKTESLDMKRAEASLKRAIARIETVNDTKQ